MNTGTLYIIGTPIGNLEDITLRAIRILGEVDLIAAEDTRHSKKLLNHLNIHKPLESYHKFNEKQKTPKLIDMLTSGKNIALVTNAGTPGISDPGETLINEAIAHEINIIPVPGPSAFVLALITSGLSIDKFVFEGFLPKKKGQKEKLFSSLKNEPKTVIFYESAQRIEKTLKDIYNILGDRKIVIARELTKKFEEIIRNNCSIILSQISNLNIKGELVLLIEGSPCIKKECSEDQIELELKEVQNKLKVTKKQAIVLVSEKLNIPKKRVYQIAIRTK